MFYFRMNLHIHFTAIENPHSMRKLHTQNPEKVNVWAGIIGENIIGPFFIDGNLNGNTYLALLKNNVVTMMANLYPAEGNPLLPGNAIWFQQDVTLLSVNAGKHSPIPAADSDGLKSHPRFQQKLGSGEGRKFIPS
ncbi:hypothetical protein NQ318_004519 [Aromia moschata]|uniref:Uncharacterized protein n=1 Tax=Aromia moschata TaxID=1265417 RepID=A0AAV8Y6Z6_9CUCU|nr:hypothetical protein NQ318_004519 [Aromia moschata]